MAMSSTASHANPSVMPVVAHLRVPPRVTMTRRPASITSAGTALQISTRSATMATRRTVTDVRLPARWNRGMSAPASLPPAPLSAGTTFSTMAKSATARTSVLPPALTSAMTRARFPALHPAPSTPPVASPATRTVW